jgi:GMP synthase (glutamine-hydrolysing)
MKQVQHAIAIRHVAFEDLGSLGDALYQRGFRITYLEAGIDDLTEVDAMAPDLLVVLGAPIGAYEEGIYPFLADEMQLLERRLRTDAPTIGICLGAQLMARALGARVYPGARREIGWEPISLSHAGLHSPLEHLAGASVLHWHGDTFDCPEGAIHLASTSITRNQAFAWKERGLALQFHPEVMHGGFERWLIGHACEISSTADCNVATLREDARRHGPQLQCHASRLWRSWLDLTFGGSSTLVAPTLPVAAVSRG